MFFQAALAAAMLARAAVGADPEPKADGKAAEAKQVPAAVRDFLQDRDYPAALAELDKELAKPDADAGRLGVLRARAQFLKGDYAEAAESFAKLAAAHAGTTAGRQARYGEALSRARNGDYKGAEAIYRAEATRLLSESRQHEIASLYLEFADLAFKPSRDDQKPDFARALEFYRKALEAGPNAARRAEVELRVGQCLQSLGQLPDAAMAFRKFVKDHAKHADVPEALFRLGECELVQGQLAEARKTWQDLVADHADTKTERIAEASYRIGSAWGMPQPKSNEALEQGVAALKSFLAKYPRGKHVGQAALDIANAYLHRGRSEDAIAALTGFVADPTHAELKELPEARVLLGNAYASQQRYAEAIAAWTEYLAKHPAHSGWSATQAAIVQAEYDAGAALRKAKKHDDARNSWEAFLAKHPLDGRAPQIMVDLGTMLHDDGKHAEAIAQWRRLVAKYPNTNESSNGQWALAQALENKLDKPDEALKEYRACTWGAFAGQAAQRVQWLTSKGMAVRTERAFRTDEAPRLKLSVRNIDAVQAKAWTVDLETYFRKTQTSGGVEALDIALIDPDKAFEFKVPKYAEHRELARDLPLELPAKAKEGAPLALAVTISTKTLEATTLVVRSDLEILAKASRDEVFVFAQNMRTGKPWPKAKLLFSNGQKVFAEAETGADGVFRQTYEELKSAGEVRVFASSDGHVAASGVGLGGLKVATGLVERGYLQTDRPGYRPGQLVHVRGVLRDVKGDQYVVPAERKATLDALDNRNRVIASQEVVLSDFGSFHAAVPLPAEAPPGTYRLIARRPDGRAHEQSFEVAEYRLEPIRIAVALPREVFYRGETVEGTIDVSYYYGAPAADKEIRYQLQAEDQPVVTARTDAKGQVKFSYPTKNFRETQTLRLAVMAPEFNLQAAKNILLSATGFSLAVSTPRTVYVQGETFEAKVVAKTPEGKPRGGKLALKAFLRTTANGVVGERLAETRELDADAKTGAATAAFTLPQGGEYVLRAEAGDRFGNLVTGDRIVTLSDDQDRVRLRILADKLTFRAGETGNVVVHWREGPALGLVTYQGAKTLGYQLIDLGKGANHLKVPMGAELAPNFELAVDAMTDTRPTDAQPAVTRLHAARVPVTVERDLKLALAIARADGKEGPIQPGMEVKVEVTATDALGNPAVGEVGLALVDQALLDRFGFDPDAAGIGKFFVGEKREIAVRTTSSITFAYAPATRGIDAQLLAEEERLLARTLDTEAASRLRDRMEMGDIAGNSVRLGGGFGGPGGGGARAPLANGRGGQAFGGMNAPAPATSAPGEAKADSDSAMAGDMPQLAGKRAKSSALFSRELGKVAADAKDKSAKLGLESNGDGLQREDRLAILNDPVSLNEKETKLDLFFGEVRDQAATVQAFDEFGLAEGKALFGNGVVQHYNWALAANRGEARKAMLGRAVAEVQKANGRFLPPGVSGETAYWNPTLATDDKGKASVTFALPERSTAWKLVGRGVTAATLAGDATADLVARKALFGDLKLPLAFTDGDQAEVEATIASDGAEPHEVVATLTMEIGDQTATEKRTVKFAGKGQQTVRFPVRIKRPEKAPAADPVAAAFTLTVAAGEASDVSRRSVAVEAFGLPAFSAASGVADADASAFLETPANVAAPSLEIVVGPTVERSLLDVLFGARSPFACSAAWHPGGSPIESTASDLLAALALQKLFAGNRDALAQQGAAIDARARAAVGALVSAQHEDGGWRWAKPDAAGNHFTTARVLWALSLAKKSGYKTPDDCLNRAVDRLRQSQAALPQSDLESTAVVQHALAVAGHADFGILNRLHRVRPSLSDPALAYLALAFVELDRKQMAAEPLALLAQRDLLRPNAAADSLPWNRGAAETRALAILAQLSVDPAEPRLRRQVDLLLAARVGSRWSPDKATGPAMLALADWFRRSKLDAERYQLEVFVNDALVDVLELDGAAGNKTVRVPAEKLAGRPRQTVRFRLVGRGRYTYQIALGGFVPAEKVADTFDEWGLSRRYEPSPLEIDGKPVPRGHDVVAGGYSWEPNKTTEAAVGERFEVHLDFHQKREAVVGPKGYPYLVLVEPIPAGTTVVEGSVKGDFQRFDVGAGAITFHLGAGYAAEGWHHPGGVSYELAGYLPGSYRATPAVVRDAYRPERMAVSKPAPLAVLPLGGKSKDERRLTPRELYELGKRHHGRGEMAPAAERLTALLKGWTLHADPYKDTVRMLLDAHLAVGPDKAVVDYFEIMKEKHPDLEIPFDKILKIGGSYQKLGEYERSYLIFRATVESAFVRDAEAAGFLEARGEFERGVQHLRRLLADYPPEPYVAGAEYALAQRVYAMAGKAAGDPKLKEARVGRLELIRRAAQMLDDFLVLHPNDPSADQASFALANALLDLKAHAKCIERCDRFAARYPKSAYLDSFQYLAGYCHFALGQSEEAIRRCQLVADAKRPNPRNGQMEASPNRVQALYIMAQVHHSLGRAAAAIAEYAKVSDQYLDARQAIEYFSRKALALPEATVVKPGAPGEVQLKFRNLAKVEVKAYRIDLLKYGLLRRDLANIANINLSGIRPYHEATVQLGDGKDYRDRTAKLQLPLKEEGAYLVVCRGEDLYATGLALVTPLVVEAQEEPESGRVRATVKDIVKNQYVTEAQVRVIGSRNPDFVAGATDLRGVFVADGIAGRSTILARAPQGYAFHRGDRELGPPAAPPPQAAQQQLSMPAKPQGGEGDADLLKNIRGLNEGSQQLNYDNLDRLYKQQRRGVNPSQAK